MEEREHLMDRQRDLEETFKPVVASNEKIARDIINESEPITEGLYELNRNLEIKEKKPPQIGSKRMIMALSPKHLSENIWMIQWIRRLVYASRMDNS